MSFIEKYQIGIYWAIQKLTENGGWEVVNYRNENDGHYYNSRDAFNDFDELKGAFSSEELRIVQVSANVLEYST